MSRQNWQIVGSDTSGLAFMLYRICFCAVCFCTACFCDVIVLMSECLDTTVASGLGSCKVTLYGAIFVAFEGQFSRYYN